MWRWLNSLRTRLTLLLALASVAGALIYAGVTQWPLPQLLVWMQTELTVKDPSAPATAAIGPTLACLAASAIALAIGGASYWMRWGESAFRNFWSFWI